MIVANRYFQLQRGDFIFKKSKPIELNSFDINGFFCNKVSFNEEIIIGIKCPSFDEPVKTKRKYIDEADAIFETLRLYISQSDMETHDIELEVLHFMCKRNEEVLF